MIKWQFFANKGCSDFSPFLWENFCNENPVLVLYTGTSNHDSNTIFGLPYYCYQSKVFIFSTVIQCILSGWKRVVGSIPVRSVQFHVFAWTLQILQFPPPVQRHAFEVYWDFQIVCRWVCEMPLVVCLCFSQCGHAMNWQLVQGVTCLRLLTAQRGSSWLRAVPQRELKIVT